MAVVFRVEDKDGRAVPTWPDKIKVIKVLRVLDTRLWLKEAKELSEQELPIVVMIPTNDAYKYAQEVLATCHHTKWEIKNM